MQQENQQTPQEIIEETKNLCEDAVLRLMERVSSELDAGNCREAIRIFLDTFNHAGRPVEMVSSEWLERMLPEGRKAKLMAAIAHYPCFACRDGYEQCDRCNGSGISELGQACALCVGTGRGRCDFCNASGLATYTAIPSAFHHVVLMERTARAVALARKHAAMRSPQQNGSCKHEMHRLLSLNKLLGVLENSVVAAQEMIDSGSRTWEELAGIVEASIEAGQIIETDLRDTLGHVAAAHQQALSQLTGIERDEAAARAEFYTRLASPGGFAGTLLDHVFLRQCDASAGRGGFQR